MAELNRRELVAFIHPCGLEAPPASPTNLPSLLALARPGHVLFGSDWPFASDALAQRFTDNLDAYFRDRADELTAINRGSADALLPRTTADSGSS